MGTSSPYTGPGDGLVPDWVDEVDAGMDSGGDGQEGVDQVQEPGQQPNQEVPLAVAPATGSTGNFSYSRGQFTRFTNGGGEKALGRALKGYVRSAGGGAGAARRMPSSTRVASGVAGLASSFSNVGPAQALAQFNLQNLAGRPAAEVLESVADVICPAGGTIDEAIARDSMLEAIADLAADDPGAFDELTPEQLSDFLCDVISRSIVTKVLNEIGTNSLHGSASDTDFREAEQITRDYTDGRVKDAMGSSFAPGSQPSQSEIDSGISQVFADSFDMLGAVLETMK